MIGIFGGTFDPIHYGHIKPVEEVYRALALQQVSYLPSANPPLRDPPICNFTHRLKMVQLALMHRPGFIVDDRDRHASGVSYTVPILQAMRKEIEQVPVCLIMGADVFSTLESWHQWQQLFALVHIVVMQRPPASSGTPEVLPAWARERLVESSECFTEQPSGLLWFQSVTPVAISASHIRKALARGGPVDGLLPEAVLDYIRANQLYR